MADMRVLPLSDQDSEHYWAALAEGHFDVQQCRECSRWTWPARPICSNCQSENLAWRTVTRHRRGAQLGEDTQRVRPSVRLTGSLRHRPGAAR